MAKIIAYNPVEGRFYKQSSSGKWFYNRPACITQNQYFSIHYNNTMKYAHLVAIELMTGIELTDPFDVEFKDNNRGNFKFDNLQLKTKDFNWTNSYKGKSANQAGLYYQRGLYKGFIRRGSKVEHFQSNSRTEVLLWLCINRNSMD